MIDKVRGCNPRSVVISREAEGRLLAIHRGLPLLHLCINPRGFVSFRHRLVTMEQSIRVLMVPKVIGLERDDFGRDADTRQCLLLDTIMQGRRRESHCRLLQMPAEILANIVDLLAGDKPALASLALVNSDCCYLARSCQFAEMHFDYSHGAQQLLQHLAKEALHETHVATRTFPIGICVRKVRFASRRECVIACHQDLYKANFGEGAGPYSQEQRDRLEQDARAHYMALRDCSTMAITHAMPNLEALAWEDSFPIDGKFLKEISTCSAQHIKLKGQLNPWLMESPLPPARWPLRSLHLDVQMPFGSAASQLQGIQQRALAEEPDNPMSVFFETLFQRCAATLESLSWQHVRLKSEGRISLGPHFRSFPLLRSLRLGFISLSPITFSSLLLSPLKHLELPAYLESLTERLVTCEPLRDLESLIISALPSQSQDCMNVAEFIRRHKRVHKLLVHEGISTSMDRFVVPVLAERGFNNLRCLSLAWGAESANPLTGIQEPCIPETALMALGTIVSLERLSLRAGNHFGWKNRWLVDHDKLRQHLGTLHRLKMLALVRDTYPVPSPTHTDAEYYYVVRWVGDGERTDAEDRADLDINEASAVADPRDQWYDIEGREDEVRIWERAHRNRMLTQAEAYAAVFPALQWVLCGQRPMGFQCHVGNHVSHKKAIPLTLHRDECYTFLNRTFGLDE